MLGKNTKIFVFLLLLFSKICLGQGDVNYGTAVQLPPAPNTTQFAKDGFKIPETAFEERLIEKTKKKALSYEEKAALDNYEGKKKEIQTHSPNFFVRQYKLFRLWWIRQRAKRKQKWLNKQQQKLEILKSDSPYQDPEKKFKLTPEEEEILKKVKEDPNSLTPEEQKVYKKIQKKQKKKQKYIEKITFIEFSEEDIKLMEEHRIIKNKNKRSKRRIRTYKPVYNPLEDTINHYHYRKSFDEYAQSLGILPATTDTGNNQKLSERKRIRLLKKAYKHDKKLNKKYSEHRIKQYSKFYGWTPAKKRTLKDYLPHITFTSKNRPSKYVRKLRRYKKRYELTQREKAAYVVARSSYANLSPMDKWRARRAARKLYLYEIKTKKVLKQAFIERQHPEVQKRLKKQNRQIKKRDRKRYRRLWWHNFKKSLKELFKPAKR